MSGTLGIIITTLVVGLIAGLLARAIVPGKDAMGIIATILLGIVGSFIGGAVAYFIPALNFKLSGIILPVIGAVIALLIYNRVVASRAT